MQENVVLRTNESYEVKTPLISESQEIITHEASSVHSVCDDLLEDRSIHHHVLCGWPGSQEKQHRFRGDHDDAASFYDLGRGPTDVCVVSLAGLSTWLFEKAILEFSRWKFEILGTMFLVFYRTSTTFLPV